MTAETHCSSSSTKNAAPVDMDHDTMSSLSMKRPRRNNDGTSIESSQHEEFHDAMEEEEEEEQEETLASSSSSSFIITAETEQPPPRMNHTAVTVTPSFTRVSPPSTATTTISSSATTPSSSSIAGEEVFSPELLHQYYARLFPFDFMHTWLSYGGGGGGGNPNHNNNNNNNNSHHAQIFSRREFSMTIESAAGEEIYIRYQSFANAKDFKEAVLKRRPIKIDLGAVFSHPPKDHKSLPKSVFTAQSRELVFDIDLTDYDGIRACGCRGAQICPKCWAFMHLAVDVIDVGLKVDFNFLHVAWFYSGRRGVHCWVCDAHARDLTDAGRAAIASYFEVALATAINQDVQLAWPLHPMLDRAYQQILEPAFVKDVIPNHQLFATPEQWNAVLDRLPQVASPVQQQLSKEWNKSSDTTSPVEKWKMLQKHVAYFLKTNRPAAATSGTANHHYHHNKFSKNNNNHASVMKEYIKLESFCAQLVFTYTYPRIDVNVSKMRNHLLKSPFCVHPKTGRVCVPFQASKVRSFDPFAVPTLRQLIHELDATATTTTNQHESSSSSHTPEWQKTSLRPYFESFQSTFLEPLVRASRQKQRQIERDGRELQAARLGEF